MLKVENVQCTREGLGRGWQKSQHRSLQKTAAELRETDLQLLETEMVK